MSDKPLTKAELKEVYDAPARRNAQRSNAHRKDVYRDPACCVKFEREKVESQQKNTMARQNHGR